MRISLFHNAGSGAGVSLQTVRDMITRAGHELVQVIDARDGAVERILDTPCDLVVAAGGDGTVGTAARALAGRGVPLAIMPLGTANNIARSLGITGSPSGVVARWGEASVRAIDTGMARGDWGQRRFVEGIGGGLMPRAIAASEAAGVGELDTLPDARLFRAIQMYRDVLLRVEPHRVALAIDGRQLDGDYLLVEVLNTRSVGANLVLSPDVDPGDGLLDVVVAGDEHRAAIDAYLVSLVEAKPAVLDLPCWRARKIELAGWRALHLDDAVDAELSAASVSIWIEPGALQILA